MAPGQKPRVHASWRTSSILSFYWMMYLPREGGLKLRDGGGPDAVGFSTFLRKKEQEPRDRISQILQDDGAMVMVAQAIVSLASRKDVLRVDRLGYPQQLPAERSGM